MKDREYQRKNNVIHRVETGTAYVFPNINMAKRASRKLGLHAVKLVEKLPVAKQTIPMKKGEIT